MTTLAIPPQPTAIDPALLPTLSVEELRNELAKSLQWTAAGFVRVAMLVAELERRGEDLSTLKIPMLAHLRAIASGQFLPELLVRYHGSPLLLRHLGRLSIGDQKRIVEKGTIPVLSYKGDDEIVQEIDPATAGSGVIYQVFADGKLRSPDEQRILLLSRKRKPQAKPPRELSARVDHEKGGIRVGKAFVPKAEVVLVLSELAGPLEGFNPDDGETATVRLTKGEKARLKALERECGLSEWQIIRNALRACGLI